MPSKGTNEKENAKVLESPKEKKNALVDALRHFNMVRGSRHTKNNEIKRFEGNKIYSAWDAEKEEWYFSVVDVVGILTDSKDAGAYWRKLKQRLKK